MSQIRNDAEDRGARATRVRALAQLAENLAGSDTPLKALAAALPDIAWHLSVDAARLMVNNAGEGEPTCLASVRWPVGAAADICAVIAARPVNTAGHADGAAEPLAVLEIRGDNDSPPVGADEQTFLDAVARLAGIGCSQAALRAVAAQQQRIAHDLALAAELQQSLQPDFDPEAVPIWGVNRPARHVSGDFFDFFRLDEEHFAFALGDVSGKGMNAALLMAKTSSLFRCLGKRIDGPGALLGAINAELCETATRGMFVTMVAGRYGLRDGVVRFANAGHEPPLLRRRDRSYETFAADAPPLGILEQGIFPETEVALDGGELYLFSDGLTEYRYASGEQLGIAGFIQLVELLAAEPPARRLEEVLDMLDQEAGWEARDDLTVLAIDDSWAGTGVGTGISNTSAAGGPAGTGA